MIKMMAALINIMLLVGFAYAGEPFNFSMAVIDSLHFAAVAKERLITSRKYSQGQFDDEFSKLISSMTTIKSAISNLNLAISQIQPFLNSETIIIRESSESFVLGYKTITQVLNNELIFLEKIGNQGPEEFLSKRGTLAKEMSEQSARADTGWRMILTATVLSTYALVDDKRTIEGKLGHLKLTSNEKKELLRRLETLFGKSVNQEPKEGQRPVEVAPKLLWKFLNDKSWKTSHDR